LHVHWPGMPDPFLVFVAKTATVADLKQVVAETRARLLDDEDDDDDDA